MKKTWKSLILAVLAAALLASCDAPAPDSGEDTTETTAPAAPKTLISATAGQDYVIVRPDVGESYHLDAVRTLQAAIKETTGMEPTLKTDWYKDSMGFPPTAHEILIDATNREESLAVTDGWRANGVMDWTVKLVGEKLVICGGSSDALNEAISYVIANCLKDGTLTVPENLNQIYQHSWPMENIVIGGHSIAEFQIVIPTGCTTLVKNCASQVQAYVRENVGVNLEIVNDSNTKAKTDYEILIGETNRGVKAPADAAGKYSYYAKLEGTRLALSGHELTISAAISALKDGVLGDTADGVYTISKDYVSASDDVFAPGIIDAMKAYVEPRAAVARASFLRSHMTNYSREDLLDVDIYGTMATTMLYLPENELTEQALELANRVIRKVTGFMNTDIPSSVKPENGGNGVDGENDFAANRLCRVLYAPEGRVEPETYEKVKRFFLNDNFQSKYFSENHMLMFRTARYLAACHFEGERFNQYKKTAEEIRKIDYDYLVDFLQYRARRGWAEFDSMGYGVEDFLSLINLYDCAPDEEIRTLAKMSMDTLLLSMITDSTENAIYGGAHGRNYGVVVSNMRSGLAFLHTLYFGTSSFDEIPESMPHLGCSFVYTSDYRPDDILYALVAEKEYPFTSMDVIHNHVQQWFPKEVGYISKSTYSTELYSMGAVNRQDPYYWIDGYEEHQQTNWSMTFANNSQATLTSHHPGNTGTHQYWCGDNNCYCNHLFAHENVVMGIYHIPGQAGEFDFIHAYVPRGQYSEVIEEAEEGRVFVRLGDAYAVLRFSAPYTWSESDSTKEIIIRDSNRRSNIRIAMVCEAGDKETYGSFEEFVKKMQAKEMVFDRDDLHLTYGNMEIKLDYTKKQTTEHNILDGVEQTYPYEYTYNSPYMTSKLDSGVITVTVGKHVRTMDYMNFTDTTVIEN